MELIERKRDGKSVVFEEERPKSNVIDLMAALEASVASMGGPDQGRAAAPEPEAAAGRKAGGGREAAGGREAGDGRAAAGDAEDLGGLSKGDLASRAADLGIAGRSKMSKPELIDAITAATAPKRRPRKIS